jgi:hypothetical protein
VRTLCSPASEYRVELAPPSLMNWLEVTLREAGSHHWCTKQVCTTCGAGDFRASLDAAQKSHASLPEALSTMDLSAWYAVEHLGGAFAIVFAGLTDSSLVDQVLTVWRARIAGHTRLMDAVVFHLVRSSRVSTPEAERWLALARAEAVVTTDPSLLESLVYVLGPRIMSDAPLLAAALAQRRGYAPLHRAINRCLGHLV